MEKYSANYSNTNHNFVIQNIEGKKIESKYFPIYCILKNILQRGCPTLMSEYLQDKLGAIHMEEDFNHPYVLIDNNSPEWVGTIKGDNDRGYYPARTFFEKIIPEYLMDYSYIQQLILPEAYINDITGEDTQRFLNQQVDFYLPQARLVIEIDGQQHKKDAARISDKERDKHFQEFGIVTVRIDTFDLENRNNKFIKKIDEIKHRLSEYARSLVYYGRQAGFPFKNIRDEKILTRLRATAIIRFQILVLSLLEKEHIKLTDKKWIFNILERDIDDFESLAIEDLFLWIENLCRLNKVEFKRPKVLIKKCLEYGDFDFSGEVINIDFSLMKRWTDENELYKKVIFIRTDYYGSNNYFKMSTSDPINYKIIQDGKNSDIPILEFFLKNFFGFDKFADGQLPIIINSLMGEDTIGLLPTGGGKSLCYQFVCLLQPCVSFVVSPIKSLMYDQKENLDRRYITNTNYISGDQSAVEKKKVSKEFADGKYHIIWISPERFQIKEFRDFLDKLNKELTIAFAVIDEVHCLSEWGHDFRTSYLNLSRTIKKYSPSTRFLGLTATASVNVLKDIMVEFEVSMDNVKTLLSYTRPELSFKVIKDSGEDRSNKKIMLKNLLRKMDNDNEVFKIDGNNTKSGLIFTIFKNGDQGCYQLSQELSREFNMPVEYYSGEVPAITTYFNNLRHTSPVMDKRDFEKYKQKVQKEFKNNKFPLLIATKAFGMGIDKSNIRYTVHFGIPGSLESLYQEAGRAGRDKEPADCYVLYSEECAAREEVNKLYDINTTVNEIDIIQKKYGKSGRDILGNFFLWLSNNKGIDYELKLILKVFKKYAKPNTTRIIKCRDLGDSFSNVQKAIYRLSLVGVVEDWVIENWDSNSGVLEVAFCDFNYEYMLNEMLSYIGKYDKEFSLDFSDSNIKDKYKEYISIFKDKEIESYEKVFRLLLKWNYDNVVYNRRQSMKTIADLCGNFTDGEEFKQSIESYFKFTESSYVLDHISQNPDDYSKWFEVFYNTEKKKQRMLDIKEIRSLRNNLSRFLESFRYNTGLNFISGIVRLLLNEYQDQDGKPRLESSFEQINTFDSEAKLNILCEVLKIGKIMDLQNKNYLGELLCRYYQGEELAIYDALKDYNSLDIILKNSSERLKRVGERIL